MKKLLIFLITLCCFSCTKYEEIDFQSVKCQQAPSGDIDIKDLKNKRFSFSLTNLGQSSETETIKVIWIIDGQTINAFNVSYQFDKKGTQSITAKLYNRCLMESILSKNLTVQ
jgi:hypothetical protein